MAVDPEISLTEIAVNDLAFRSLNNVPLEPSRTTAEALDHLTEFVRRGALGITAALLEIAQAIEKEDRET